jgi:hypothetical protein
VRVAEKEKAAEEEKAAEKKKAAVKEKAAEEEKAAEKKKAAEKVNAAEEEKATEMFVNSQIAAVVKILSSFKDSSKELFQFLRTISIQELEQLKEYVNDYEEEGVST